MLSQKKVFLFDIDGTLAIDNTLYEGTKDLIDYINSIGGQVFYITNNSTKSRKDYVKKFAAWGIQTNEKQFVTASYATMLFLSEQYEKQKIFVMGTPSFLQELKEQGLCVTEQVESDVACVVVGFDSSLSYSKIEAACELLFRKGVDYVATNADLRCPTSYGFTPDCGGICEMINKTVDRSPYYVGKPNRVIVDLCLKQAKANKEEVLVVGDRLYTDIACGINAGVETAAVLTGETTEREIEQSEFQPDYCFATVRELFQTIKEGII